MPADGLLKLKEAFTEKGILICFNGPFSHSIIEEIGSAIRKHLESEEAPKGASLDVFAVYVEQAQNVKNYLAGKRFPVPSYYSAIIVIAGKDGRYTISSGNVIEQADTAALIELLEKINHLDREGLKKFYKEQRRKELPQGSTGARLGLIDIARRASEKLSYQVTELDEHYSFFSLAVVV